MLSSRPAESERGLAHAGLGDLFDGALDDVLPSLTAPQRRALEVALLVEDAGGRPVDTRALGVAVRNALQLLAEDGLVVAIDDLQWLDASSASALGFALRRLPDTSMLLLWTRRLDAGEQTSVVEAALDSDRIDRIRVGPLSVGATHQLLRARLSRTVSRPTLLRLHEASGGNPFYALELARAALGADGALADPTQPLPVPERLEELVSTRLDGFTGATRDALVLASAHGRLTVTELGRAGIEQGALEPALAEQVDRGGAWKRAVHAPAAGVGPLPGADCRRAAACARHARRSRRRSGRPRSSPRALDQRADAELACELEQAAAGCRSPGRTDRRGRARRVRDPAYTGRRPRCARPAHSSCHAAHAVTGGIERARTLSEELLAVAAPGPARAEALALAAEVEGDYIGRAIELQREALAEPGAPAALCAALHRQLGLSVRFRRESSRQRSMRAPLSSSPRRSVTTVCAPPRLPVSRSCT